MKQPRGQNTTNKTFWCIALGLTFASFQIAAQPSNPRGLFTLGEAKTQQSAQAMQAACQQKALSKGETPGAAKEICASELPECSANGLPTGCVYAARSSTTPGKTLTGEPSKQLLGGK
jgi:hypothetical protein